MSKLAGIAGGALCLLGAQIDTALAAEGGFYFGVSGGQSEYKVDIDDFGARASSSAAFQAQNGFGPVLGQPGFIGPIFAQPGVIVGGTAVLTPVVFAPFQTTSLDRTDATWSFTAGYRINRYVSVELSYLDLGEAAVRNVATFSSSLSSFDLTLVQRVEIEGVSAAVLGTWPIAERWSLHARGGYEFTDSEARVDINGTNLFTNKDSSDSFVVGLGVDFAWASHWSLRAEAERHLDLGGEVFEDDADVDVYRLAVLYRL